MSKRLNYQGFSEPKENYYRLPNEWFEFWDYVRAHFGPRFVALLKMLEYIFLHTWGASKFDGKVRLSANEIHSGKRKNKEERWDSGVGISENAVRKAGEMLVKLGILVVERNTKDKARQWRSYQLKLRDHTTQITENLITQGFSNPETNYFKIPKSWITAMREIGSAAVILAVEYLIRHAWGYQNPKGVWLTAEEVANGRKYADGTRYDNGTGFALATIQRALKEAGKLGLVAWREKFDGGIIFRVYNLRFEGMKIDSEGRLIDDTNDANEEVCDVDKAVLENANDVITDLTEETNDANEEVCDVDEERSLKDTIQDTQTKHVVLTPTTPATFEQSESPPTPQAQRHVVGDGYNKKQKPNASDELPEEITEALRSIGWADKTSEISKMFQKNPALIRDWIRYVKRVPESEIKKNRAALFRHGIRTGVLPPELPDYHEYFADEGDEIHEDAPTSTLQNTRAQEIWKTVVSMLAMKLPLFSKDTWATETQALNLDGNTLIIGVRDAYTREICESRLRKTVSNLLIGILNAADTDVKFVVMEPAL